MPKTDIPGREALQKVADLVSTKNKVELKSAKDVSVAWCSTSVHPLQFLETIHQKLSQDAARAVKTVDNPNASDQQQAEQEKVLSRFCGVIPQEPQMMMEKGQDEVIDSSYVGKLNNAKKALTDIAGSLSLSSTSTTKNPHYIVSLSIKENPIIADGSSKAKISVRVLNAADQKPITMTPNVEFSLQKQLGSRKITGFEDPSRAQRKSVTIRSGKAEVEFFSGDKEGKLEIIAKVAAPVNLKVTDSVYLVSAANDSKFINDTKKNISEKVVKPLKKVYDDFLKCDGNAPTFIPPLGEAKRILETPNLVAGADTRAKLKKLCGGELESLVNELEKSVEGLAQVQMLHGIDAFYLYRLLVPFNIVAGGKVDKDVKRGVSGDLTDIINNDNNGEMKWLRDWLKTKMISIAKSLNEKVEGADNKVFFFLKGGRALYYLLEDEAKAMNDWDTAVVVNPELPAQEWYETFNRASNILLEELRIAKKEFFILLHKNINSVNKRIKDYRAKKSPAILEERPDEYIEEEGNACKAELIDIGIPRRDTIEAIEQWHHYHNKAKRICDGSTSNIWIPGHLYFVDEYIVMVREALAGLSPAPHKAHKRIDRLYSVMKTKDNRDAKPFDKAISDKRTAIDGPLYTKSIGLAKSDDPLWKGRIATVLLEQFMNAYDLKLEPGLAKIFDDKFNTEAGNLASIVLPQSIEKGLNERKKGGGDLYPHKADLKSILQWVALADKLSGWRPDQSKEGSFEKHFEDRAKFFGFHQSVTSEQIKKRRILGNAIKAIYTYGLFKQNEELEIQLAVCGSFAAFLHAEYAHMDKKLHERIDPVKTIEVKIFCAQKNADPKTVIELIRPALDHYILNGPNPKFKIEKGSNNSLNIYWPQEVMIGTFNYQPLVFRITVEVGIRPQLSFIWGYPVLSLRDLVREYDRKAALTEEWGRKQKLKATSNILKELLTRYDFQAELPGWI